MVALLFLAGGLNSYALTKSRIEDVWSLARQADIVVLAEVTSADTNITFKIDQLLKGETKDTTITFPAPPVPVIDSKIRFCPPERGWSFTPGEKWIVFLGDKEGLYEFIDARKHRLPEAAQAVQQCLNIDSIDNDEEKVRELVSLAVNLTTMSSFPAFRDLEALNRPEFLDLFRPLAKIEQCKWRYVSLLGENSNPKATDLLGAMLYTEKGDALRRTLDAVGRKDQKNEDLSKELVTFLSHTNPVIRQTSVFILNYRDYHNGFSNIVVSLDDPDPRVRASALYWPWYAYVKEHPEAKKKLKQLRKDNDPHVRDAAKRALAGISPWYRFWHYGK